jgi:mRNA interferase RelE/StbE
VGASWHVDITKSALKQLSDLPERERAQVARRIGLLGTNPFPQGAKKLHDEEAAYRERSGDYRILYDVTGDVVTVVAVRNRREAYRRRR